MQITIHIIYIPLIDKPRCADIQYSNITFHGEVKIATITSSTPTVDMVDVGVSLSVQDQESLDLVDNFEFKVHPCLAGPFVLPADYRAASPVYLIQPSTSEDELYTDVTVCIHHCAILKSEEDCRNMRFLSASSTSQEEGSPTYTFTEMNGKFKEGNQIGEIIVKDEFGLFAVAIRGNKGL